MTTTFEIVSECPCDAEELFDASLNIDAHVDSMATSSERAVGAVRRGQIGLGETVTCRATGSPSPHPCSGGWPNGSCSCRTCAD